MIVCRTPAALQSAPGARPRALVPTMGALHAGHLSLLDRARAQAVQVWATLFVNRVQFDDADDFARYPRDEAADFAQFEARGVDLVYAPNEAAVWGGPPGDPARHARPGLTDILEGRHRPGHLAAVAAVVARLFEQTTPDLAVFGEKDYQQLLLVRAIAAERRAPVRILAAPVVREPDGLALSSRNRLLGPKARAQAAQLPAALSELARRAASCAPGDIAQLERAARARLEAGGLAVDYVVVRDARDLSPCAARGPRIALAAVRAGGVRLLDAVRAD